MQIASHSTVKGIYKANNRYLLYSTRYISGIQSIYGYSNRMRPPSLGFLLYAFVVHG